MESGRAGPLSGQRWISRQRPQMFCSQAPIADVLVTMAAYDDPEDDGPLDGNPYDE